jgi:hypothetical protein
MGWALHRQPACYSGNGPFYSADAAWRNWFFYGGPGKEGSGCT